MLLNSEIRQVMTMTPEISEPTIRHLSVGVIAQQQERASSRNTR